MLLDIAEAIESLQAKFNCSTPKINLRCRIANRFQSLGFSSLSGRSEALRDVFRIQPRREDCVREREKDFSTRKHLQAEAIFLSYFFLFHCNQNSRTREVCNDVDYESDIENRACQSRKRSSDQISSVAMLPHKNNSPIHPHQDLVKCIESLQSGQHDETKNGRYELISIGKVPSESSLKLNSTLPSKAALKSVSHWHPSEETINDYKQASSMTNININNNIDKSIGCQQLGTSNLCIIRSRTQTKSLSTRISSLKRESKTTRTLSIGEIIPQLIMFRSA